MKSRTAFLSASLTALLACHGELVIGGVAPTDGGGPAISSPDGGPGTVLVEPDGGTIVIPPQTLVVNKVDLLFMIDNSASMGDKQAYLDQAVPELVTRLVTPNCVDSSDPTVVYGPSTADASGNVSCPSNQRLEFPAVHDMHIGIVSSSLGPRLSDQQPSDGSGGVCLPTATITIGGVTVDQHNDDQAHLLTRSSTPSTSPNEVPLPDAASGFLAWFPNAAANNGKSGTPGVTAVTSSAILKSDFADLVAGVHQYGCGIESQLESWYRFLIQPDPYASLGLDTSNPQLPKASWVGVDSTILKERHDFLRPDSLVAIVDLSDENDSEIDVRSLGGQGYLFMSTKFMPPHGTAVCDTNPADPSCLSCPLAPNGGAGDPGCAKGSYQSPTDWGYDLNLRHVHMKAKYGLDPQFPIGRYQNGLASPKVPDRAGEYPPGAQSYVGVNDCTNPLYAASLPDGSRTDAATLCNLPQGPRTAGLVYFLHIGGVPQALLHYSPTDPAASVLTSADWVKILGRNPLAYDYTGIDPHMIESYQPRAGLPGPSQANNADPISGREWITDVGPHLDLNLDRQYACIFPLAVPRDCTTPDNRFSCDCSSTGLTHEETSPVCDPTTPTNQVAAKAYPTIRELTLAKLLGPQGVVASICPVDVIDSATATDPLYGYRPAVLSLVDRMRPALAFAGK